MAKKPNGTAVVSAAEVLPSYRCPTCDGVQALAPEAFAMSAIFCPTCVVHYPVAHYAPAIED